MKDSFEAADGPVSGEGDGGWITVRHAARQLDIPPRQLYDLIDRGVLAAYHVDDDLVLRPGDVIAYREQHPR